METVFWVLLVSFVLFLVVYRVLVWFDVIHEHRPSEDIWFDGASLTSRCKCGAELLQDSQGGWFDV